MTSQLIKTTVKYLGGTYTGEIEPYPGSASGDSSSEEVKTPTDQNDNISELINLIHEYNLMDKEITRKFRGLNLATDAAKSGSTTVNTVLGDVSMTNATDKILNQLEELIQNQRDKVNKMNAIFKKLNIDNNDYIKNNYIKNQQKMLDDYTQRIKALNSKKQGGNTTFNKRRHSRHLMPSLKKRKHSFTRRKRN